MTGLEQLRGDALDQQPEAAVGRDELPMAVDDQCWMGVMAGQYQVERVTDGGHRGVLQVVLAVQRRVPRGEEQLVALAQRHLELAGQQEDHLSARTRAPGLDEGQVPRRDARGQ